MPVVLSEAMMALLPELRIQPMIKQLTVRLGPDLVARTDRPLLVMEPMRIVPSYAVPVTDLRVPLEPAAAGPPPEYRPVGFGDGPPLLDPSVAFGVHTAEGEPVVVRAGDRSGDGFRPAALADHVVLDFDAFDWWEEDEPLVGHPRDPFHRIDVRRSSRHVRISHDGTLLADSRRPWALFEATFPLPRWYLPREDVAVELLPSQLHTTCAYKGHATHYSAEAGGALLEDVAWSYEQPLEDAAAVAGCVAFYQERLDVEVDGVPVVRRRTPWSD
ncbi:MAG TPA: DUF427 domain-containing protein [Nocardioides sp.]|nr:DUF427 domain-containing protein [Nocardioides sp.]